MIYLDYAAATPVSDKTWAAMRPFEQECFFNPSAPYRAGREARVAYEEAKTAIARTIGAKGADLVMTSGATESIALAFNTEFETGVDLSGFQGRFCAASDSDFGPEAILIGATEHAAVRAAAQARGGFTEVKVDKGGLIDLQDLKTKITGATRLISIALVNNELGVVQPFGEIAELVRKERQRRLATGVTTPIYLHTDASQAMGLLTVKVARLGVDLMTLNAAKVGGPKGVGALYVGHNVKIRPLMIGGGQERGLRGGTENVAGVVGFVAALTEAQEHLAARRKHAEALGRILREGLARAVVEPVFLGSAKKQLANFCPVSFPGLDAERLIYLLEEQGVMVATGAACAASKGVKSRTLVACGYDTEMIQGSLRITTGVETTEEEAVAAAEAICAAVKTEKERIEQG